MSSLRSQETQLGSLPASSAPPSSQAPKKPSVSGLNDYRLVAHVRGHELSHRKDITGTPPPPLLAYDFVPGILTTRI